MPAGELHLQLAVNFPRNRKVRALVRFGRHARALRDLYVQMCLHSKDNLSDGFIPDEEIGVLVYPDSVKNGKRDAERLIEVGLIERGIGGYLITGWFDRNLSRQDVRDRSAAKARGARLANHRRWHVEFGNPDSRCEWCQSSDQTTDKNTDQMRDQSHEDVLKRSDSTETESETESEKNIKPLGQPRLAGRDAEVGSDADPGFAAFWSAYPLKVAKGAARRAWRTAVITKKTDPKTITAAAEHYADDPARRSRDRKYTAHPATWLNGERWLEWGDDARTDPGDDLDFWTS
jgi:hypothetical protein